MENKQSKPHLKVSIFDVIIIAVVIISAAVLIFVWRASGKSSGTAIITKPVHYTIQLAGMIDGAAEKIKKGDTIIDSTKKFNMGTVESVSIAPATIPVNNKQTGDTVLALVPDKETASVELVCNCSTTDSQILAASGYLVRVGEVVHAAGPGYAGLGYIVEINREDLSH